ncbi:UNVERIFIED_CONTAM: hypothetical protein K2H54_048694 [Gekko kuhli]
MPDALCPMALSSNPMVYNDKAEPKTEVRSRLSKPVVLESPVQEFGARGGVITRMPDALCPMALSSNPMFYNDKAEPKSEVRSQLSKPVVLESPVQEFGARGGVATRMHDALCPMALSSSPMVYNDKAEPKTEVRGRLSKPVVLESPVQEFGARGGVTTRLPDPLCPMALSSSPMYITIRSKAEPKTEVRSQLSKPVVLDSPVQEFGARGGVITRMPDALCPMALSSNPVVYNDKAEPKTEVRSQLSKPVVLDSPVQEFGARGGVITRMPDALCPMALSSSPMVYNDKAEPKTEVRSQLSKPVVLESPVQEFGAGGGVTTRLPDPLCPMALSSSPMYITIRSKAELKTEVRSQLSKPVVLDSPVQEFGARGGVITRMPDALCPMALSSNLVVYNDKAELKTEVRSRLSKPVVLESPVQEFGARGGVATRMHDALCPMALSSSPMVYNDKAEPKTEVRSRLSKPVVLESPVQEFGARADPKSEVRSQLSKPVVLESPVQEFGAGGGVATRMHDALCPMALSSSPMVYNDKAEPKTEVRSRLSKPVVLESPVQEFGARGGVATRMHDALCPMALSSSPMVYNDKAETKTEPRSRLSKLVVLESPVQEFGAVGGVTTRLPDPICPMRCQAVQWYITIRSKAEHKTEVRSRLSKPVVLESPVQEFGAGGGVITRMPDALCPMALSSSPMVYNYKSEPKAGQKLVVETGSAGESGLGVWNQGRRYHEAA